MSRVWPSHVTHVNDITYMTRCDITLCVCCFVVTYRPTQSIMYVPLQVNRFKKIILLIVRYKYLKSCSRRFYCPNLILCTRLCGTMFITQPSCLFDFHLTELVRRKWFVLAVYQFWKGISAGPALKYFTWFIGAGGLNWFVASLWHNSIRLLRCVSVSESCHTREWYHIHHTRELSHVTTRHDT